MCGPSQRRIASTDPGGSAPPPSSRPRSGRAPSVVREHGTGGGPAELGSRARTIATARRVGRSPRPRCSVSSRQHCGRASTDPPRSVADRPARGRTERSPTAAPERATGQAAQPRSGARVKAVAASSGVSRSPRAPPAPPPAAATPRAHPRSGDTDPDGSDHQRPRSPLGSDAVSLERKRARARHASPAGLSAPRTPSSDRRPGRSP